MLLALSLGLEATPADDWPQWGGPQRDLVWREEGIVEMLPPVEPAAVDVQKQVEAAAAAAEAARPKGPVTPLTEVLPPPDPAKVQEIPL